TTRALLLLALAVFAGCGSDERSSSSVGGAVAVEVPPETPRVEREPVIEPPVREPVEPVKVTLLPGADRPGPVYLVINTRGVARLDQTGVTLVLDRPERNIQDLFVGPDGAAYLVDARSLRKLEGDAVVEVVRFGFDDVAPVDELALAPDGTIWVTGSRGVGRYQDGRWTIRSREQLGLGFHTDIAVGHDGVVWVASSTKLLRRPVDSDEWI